MFSQVNSRLQELKRSNRKNRKTALMRLTEINSGGKNGITALKAFFKQQGYSKLKIELLELLETIDKDWALGVLAELLTHPDPDFRWRAAEQLGKRKNDQNLDHLITALHDKHSWVRSRAAAALGELASPKAVRPLLECLVEEHFDILAEIATALANIGDERAIDPMINLCNNKFPNIRRIACWTLGEFATPAVITPLIERLEDEDLNVRKAALESLVKTGVESVQFLLDILEKKKQECYGEVIIALGQIKDARAVVPLVKLLDSIDDNYRHLPEIRVALLRIGEPAIEPLFHALNQEKHRENIASLLVKFDRAAIDTLIEKSELLQTMTEEGVKTVLQVLNKLSPEIEQVKALEPLLLACLLSIDDEESKEITKKFLKRVKLD